MRVDTGIADEEHWAQIQIYDKSSHNLNSQSFLGPNDYNHDDEMIIKTICVRWGKAFVEKRTNRPISCPPARLVWP